MFNSLGQKIKDFTCTDSEFSKADLTEGIYFLKVSSKGEFIGSEKVIVY